MKNIIWIFLLFSVTVFAGDPIPCAPPAKPWSIAATHVTVRDGDFWSPSTWASGIVPNETDNVDINHRVTSSRNIIRRSGRTYSSTGQAVIKFTGINVSRFVGEGHDPLPDDIGLWIMGDAQLQLEGEEKQSWSNLVGSATKGMTVINVKNTSGWKVNDKIVVFPTDKPAFDVANSKSLGFSWNTGSNRADDPMIAKFERFTVRAVSGTSVTLDRPLAYDHLQTVTDHETFTAEVANLTRSIVIEGSGQGAESHIFIRSSKPQTIRYIEGRYLGPTKPGNKNLNLVTGRYGLHFHHSGNGSNGSIVEGCAFYDLRNRVYVPHMSNGITFRRNVGFNSTQEFFWWDILTQSHNITYEENLMGLRVYNGNYGGTTGMDLGQGDNNKAIGNVAVYVHHGDLHQQGAYAWNANNQGVWFFDNNLSHSNGSGGFVWQNTGEAHVISRHRAYNNAVGWFHGAYINSYFFEYLNFYNSPFRFEASPGNLTTMIERSTFDGGGKIPFTIEVVSSPVPTSPNGFRGCLFKGFTNAAFHINTRIFPGEIGRKGVDVIHCDIDGKIAYFDPQSIYDSYLRVQPKNGQAQRISQKGTTNISPFAPMVAGTGTGLIGRYYNGANFNAFAFERLDPMIKFQGWSVDKQNRPNGIDHRMNPTGAISLRIVGKYQAQKSGQLIFSVKRIGGARLYFDNKMILDRWQETSDKDDYFDASAVVVESGKMYDIRLEYFDLSGERGLELLTKENGTYIHVPISQLYPSATAPPPPPAPNRPPTVSAGPDLTMTLPDSVIKIEGEANDVDTNLAKVVWTGPAAVQLSQTLSESSHVLAKVKKAGTYELTITATDRAGLKAVDKMILKVTAEPADTTQPPPTPPTVLQANAGPDLHVNGTVVTLDASLSTGNIARYRWYFDGGPRQWNLSGQDNKIAEANRLVPGVYTFRLRVTDDKGKTSDDRMIVTVGAVPPVETWPKIKATFELEGKKIIVYENEDKTWTIKVEG